MKTKKILISTISYFPSFAELAVYYLKAYLEKYMKTKLSELAIDMQIFPASENINTITKYILEKDPAILAFSCYIWNIEKILKVSKEVKEIRPQIKIILGGPEVTPRAEEIIKTKKFIDIVAMGEGEETFLELVDSLIYQKIGLASIKGITYRDKNKISKNPDRPLIKDINKIPSPYLLNMVDLKKYSLLPIETMRGCPFKCTYCFAHKFYPTVRYFSVSRVKKELKYIFSKKPFFIFNCDSSFNIDRKRAKDILKILIHNKNNLGIGLFVKAELLDKETAELFCKAKATLEIGIQSTNPKTVRAINRDFFKKGIFKKNAKILRDKKVRFSVDLMYPLPYEDYESMKRSLDWAISLRSSAIAIYCLKVLPGTYIWEHADCLKIKHYPKPPYLTYKSDSMSKYDLKRVAALISALELLYNLRMMKEAIYAIKNKIGISISEIFEEWDRWERRFYYKIYHRRRKGCLRPTICKEAYIIKLSENACDFLKYLCKKYKKESSYQYIGPMLQKDIAKFLVEIQFIKLYDKSRDKCLFELFDTEYFKSHKKRTTKMLFARQH